MCWVRWLGQKWRTSIHSSTLTSVLSVTISVTLVISSILVCIYSSGHLTNYQLMIAFNIVHFLMEDILICVIQPIIIILKTKKYLPQLWDNNCQIETDNNDFYAVNPFQVYPMNDLA